MLLETHTEPDFPEKFFLSPKLEKLAENRVFFNLLKMGQNILYQSDYRIFQSAISPEQINEMASFFAC